MELDLIGRGGPELRAAERLKCWNGPSQLNDSVGGVAKKTVLKCRGILKSLEGRISTLCEHERG